MRICSSIDRPCVPFLPYDNPFASIFLVLPSHYQLSFEYQRSLFDFTGCYRSFATTFIVKRQDYLSLNNASFIRNFLVSKFQVVFEHCLHCSVILFFQTTKCTDTDAELITVKIIKLISQSIKRVCMTPTLKQTNLKIETTRKKISHIHTHTHTR